MERILILGGTNFIGRYLVEKLIEMNTYDLTLLNRGQTNSDLFPKLKTIISDRNHEDIKKAINGNWDYVIDVSCYHPNDLKNTLACLNDNLERYIFISTCYYSFTLTNHLSIFR